MTLEELLKDIKNKKACAAADYKECIAREHGCKDCPFAHVGIDILYPEIIERLEELKTLRKAFGLACKAIQEETEPNYCDVLSYGPCRKGNAVGKVWDDNKCAECCMECFLTQAQESEANNEDEQKRSQDV